MPRKIVAQAQSRITTSQSVAPQAESAALSSAPAPNAPVDRETAKAFGDGARRNVLSKAAVASSDRVRPAGLKLFGTITAAIAQGGAPADRNGVQAFAAADLAASIL
jgi:hypothetical protein